MHQIACSFSKTLQGLTPPDPRTPFCCKDGIKHTGTFISHFHLAYMSKMVTHMANVTIAIDIASTQGHAILGNIRR